MACYAAFLGSINVGGNQLKMDALRMALGDAGFANVATVVASGNVLFDSEAAPDDALATKIADVIERRFVIRSFAAVRSRNEVASAVADNPFNGHGEDKFVHTHFLDGPLTDEGFARLVSDHNGPERLAPGDRALFVDYADGVGTSKLTKVFIEKRIGRQGTARNVRSLSRILAKMDGR